MAREYTGLNKQASELIEAGLKRAEKDSNASVYTIHVLLEVYKGEYAEFLEKATGFTGLQIEEIYKDMIVSGMIVVDTDNNDTRTVDDFHDELNEVLEHCKSIAMSSNFRIDPITLLRTILSDRTYARAILRENGVSINRLKQLRPVEYEYPMLRKCAGNLTMRMFMSDELCPVNRPKEMSKIIEILGRKDKRNPLLIGDSGVGKTALVELLAKHIWDDESIPSYLAGKIVMEIDISAVVGGSQFRGAFEEKFNSLIYQAEQAGNIIMFFDEFHTMIRAGGSTENDLNAANILKPALARKLLPVIGTTTTKEYNKYIEKDEALSRRFETIMVDEPSDEDTIHIVTGAINTYEKFHNAEVTPDVIEYAVKLSSRYMTSKKQPDKTFTVIDQTCAHLKMHSTDDAIIIPNKQDIRNTVSRITDIQIGDLTMDEFKKLRTLADKLKESVIGQDQAVKAVSDAIRRNKVGLSAHDKPIGTFLFVGPTGVGKTELCKRLNDEFNSGHPIVRLDMSEYMEKHTVSRLIGSPPGYVGHEDGGQLTDAVRRNPYSIVLLDEIEKAHQDVFNILLQILDDGRLTDSHGKVVDFCNTIIVMTSNAGYGASQSTKLLGFGTDEKNATVSEEDAVKALQKTFRPEFLNRLDKIVVFNSLSKKDCTGIAKLLINKLVDRCRENNIYITFDDSIVESVVDNGFNEQYGARNLKRYIQTNIEGVLADKVIDGEIKPKGYYKASFKNGELVVKSTRKPITSKISLPKNMENIELEISSRV